MKTMTDTDNCFGKVAEYWQHVDDGNVRCDLCPNRCVIKEGHAGLCRSRKNVGGKLYSMVYGCPCAINIDPIEKKPLLHFHPGQPCLSIGCTGCNLSCLNCQNWEISQARPNEVRTYPLSPEELVETAKANNCSIVAFTYTEPLTYLEYTRDCAAACHREGLETVLVTAGYVNRKPLSDLLPYINAANVDLKSFSDAVYQKVSRAHLQTVLETLKTMKKSNVWIEVTNLMIPGVNDNPDMVRQMCQWLAANGFCDTPLHFSRFFPQYRMEDFPPTPLETLIKAREIARNEGLHFVYIGNTHIEGAEDTVCPECHKGLIRRNGYKIMENTMKSDDTKCPYCGNPIAGLW